MMKINKTGFLKLLEDAIDNRADIIELHQLPLEYSLGQKCNKTCAKGLKVLLLCAPCYGYGDVVFARKIAQYINDWYGIVPKIATTQPEKFIKLGQHKKDLLTLIKKGGRNECRRFADLKLMTLNHKLVKTEYDLILIAPLLQDFKIDYNDVKRLVPNSTPFNIYFMSEYNIGDRYSKHYDFPTGFGHNYHGILLNDPPKGIKCPKNLKNPFNLVYISGEPNVPDSRKKGCFFAFLEMVTRKYGKRGKTHHKKLDVVVPSWIVQNIQTKKNWMSLLQKMVGTNYNNIVAVDTKGKHDTISKGQGEYTLTIRGDILPVDNKTFFGLMKYSLPDILLTGNQSVTDLMSCCWRNKNLYYQIMDSTELFADKMAAVIPDKYMSSVKTSCGTLKKLKYNSDYRKLVKNNDFRKKARPLFDAIMINMKLSKRDPLLKQYLNLLKKHRSAKLIYDKLT